MSTRQRILLIRLMEKIEKHPLYAKSLGIDSAPVMACTDDFPPSAQPQSRA